MGKNSSHLREKERKKMPKENKGLFQNQKEAMGVKLEDSATRGQEGLADEGVSLGRCQERARRALKKMTRGTHARLGPGDSSPLTQLFLSDAGGVWKPLQNCSRAFSRVAALRVGNVKITQAAQLLGERRAVLREKCHKTEFGDAFF